MKASEPLISLYYTSLERNTAATLFLAKYIKISRLYRTVNQHTKTDQRDYPPPPLAYRSKSELPFKAKQYILLKVSEDTKNRTTSKTKLNQKFEQNES